MAFNVGDYVRTKRNFYVRELQGKEGRIAFRNGVSYGMIFFSPCYHLHNGIFENCYFLLLPQWTYSFQDKRRSFWVSEDELVMSNTGDKIEGDC